MSLSDFLLARIAEDEADAHHVSRFSVVMMSDGYPSGVYTNMRDRVLAECEAKRRIVSELTIQTPGSEGEHLATWTLAHLAAVYADHPDYREEWRP